VIRLARQALARVLDLDTLLANAMTEGRRDAERERPKVGPWVEHGTSVSVYDERGQGVASVWQVDGRGWWWWATRPHLPPLDGQEVPSAEEAQAAALAVLETWADVSAARVAVSPGGLTMSGPVSPTGEGGQES
jgi:hypothetical protein